MAGATWNCCRLGAFCLHHSTMHYVTSCKLSHIRKVYACLAVTCHLHFWQNDRGLLRATAVTRRWNGYRNQSQHKSWPWRRKFSRRSCRDSNPQPFNHESGALTTEPSPMEPYLQKRRGSVVPPRTCSRQPRGYHQVQCRFTSTETLGNDRDKGPRMATSTFTHTFSSVLLSLLLSGFI